MLFFPGGIEWAAAAGGRGKGQSMIAEFAAAEESDALASSGPDGRMDGLAQMPTEDTVDVFFFSLDFFLDFWFICR